MSTLTFATFSFVTLGMTAAVLPRSYTTYSRRTACRSGLVSEKDVELGVPLLRAIDKGLAKSRAGIVLVTPALLRRLASEGIADKELSELLARDQLIPVVHETTYEALREVSPLLGSRTGLNAADDSMADIAIKIAELVVVYR
jgi:hypothetical protein